MKSHCLIKTKGNLKYNNIAKILISGEKTILNMEKWREVISWTDIRYIQHKLSDFCMTI